MKWCITGGCGFIGTNLIRKLVKDNHNYIRILDDLSIGTLDSLGAVCNFEQKNADSLSALPGRVDFIQGSILDESVIETVCHDIDVIVHFAANAGVPSSVKDPRMDCMKNVIGTLNMLEGGRKAEVDRFVFASSSAPLGDCSPPIHEEIAAHPTSPYGASKLAGEGYCSAYYNSYGLQTVVLRFGNVYGPGSSHKSSVVAKFINQALKGEKLEIYGDGTQTRDFIFVEDLVDAVFKAATIPDLGGELFQIATFNETTVGEITELLTGVLKDRFDIHAVVVNGEKRTGDIFRTFSDISKAKKLMEYDPKTSLKEGIFKTIQDLIKTKQ
jgi:UDP-glucose 4-epimerase